MDRVFNTESERGSIRIAGTAFTPIDGGRVIEVVAIAVIAKLKEKGIAADSGVGTAQVDRVMLTGIDGTVIIEYRGYKFPVVFNTNLTTTASDFVTTHSTAFAALGVTLTSSTGTLIFTAAVAGIPLSVILVRPESGTLSGVVVTFTANVTNPLVMHGIAGVSLAVGEKIYARTEFEGIQLTSGTVMVR